MRQLLGDGRKDESGDFTKGAELTLEQSNLLLWMLKLRSTTDCDRMGRATEANPLINLLGGGEAYKTDMLSAMDNAYGSASAIFRDGVSELRAIADLVTATGYSDGRIQIDPSVVRGLEYYTGPVFEAELTFKVTGETGRPVRFGSVGGGGRYDGLVARFREEPVPATGFSIGVSRLLAALRAIKSPIVAAAEAPGPVVVLALDRDADSMANYQRLVAGICGQEHVATSRPNSIWAPAA